MTCSNSSNKYYRQVKILPFCRLGVSASMWKKEHLSSRNLFLSVIQLITISRKTFASGLASHEDQLNHSQQL